MGISEKLIVETEKLRSETRILKERLSNKVIPPMIERLSSCVNDIYNFSPVLVNYYNKADS
jgi:hypothetical protein